MGCTSTKTHHHQYNIKLPSSLEQQTLQTESDLSEYQDQFLQIGLAINSLGELRPPVQAICEKLGQLFPQQNTQHFQYMGLPDDSIFYGEFQRGRRNGIGKQHWIKEGNFLEGSWIEDHLCGKARMIYPNGDYFEGLFSNNVANGQGKFISSKKKVQGIWINNKLSGEGQEKRENGTVYKGSFLDGKIDGLGCFHWGNGCIYVGMVSKGKMQGKGELQFVDQSKYMGEFRNNQISGKGIYRDKEGYFQSKYEQPFLKIFYSDRQLICETSELTLIQLSCPFE